MADIASSLPQLDLAAGAAVEVDVGSAGAVIVSVTVYGTYFPPGTPPPPQPVGEWLTVPSSPPAGA